MFCFCRKPEFPFHVKVHLNGRHPYLRTHELDYETRDVELLVSARDWNHAAEVAMNAAGSIPNKWSWRVLSIEKAKDL
jgi:hypothetical protein